MDDMDDIFAKHPLTPGVKYGLRDTVDNLWMGDADGPTLYEDQLVEGKMFPGSLMARIAAEMVDIRLRQEVRRTRSEVFDDCPVAFRDEKKAKITLIQALRGKESGLYL